MAIVNNAVSWHEANIGYGEESTFGTALAGSTNYAKYRVIGGSVPAFVPDKFIDTDMQNRALRVRNVDDNFSTANNRWQRISVPRFRPTLTDAAHLLYGAVQNVTEAAGTPFQKTYNCDGATNPDFSANAGYFATIFIDDATVGGTILTSCVAESLDIYLSPEDGGRMNAEVTWLSGKGYNVGPTLSGTPTFDSTAIVNFTDSTARTLSINSVDQDWIEAHMRIENSWAWVGYAGSGVANNYELVEQRVLFNCRVKADTQSDDLRVGDSVGSNVGVIDLTIGDVTPASGYFNFNSNKSVLLSHETDRGSSDTVQSYNLSFDCVTSSAATSYPVFKIATGVDMTW